MHYVYLVLFIEVGKFQPSLAPSRMFESVFFELTRNWIHWLFSSCSVWGNECFEQWASGTHCWSESTDTRSTGRAEATEV